MRTYDDGTIHIELLPSRSGNLNYLSYSKRYDNIETFCRDSKYYVILNGAQHQISQDEYTKVKIIVDTRYLKFVSPRSITNAIKEIEL